MIDRDFDEQQAERAQAGFDHALDHGLDLEVERVDCDPSLEICNLHGEWIPTNWISAECPSCIGEATRRVWIDPEYLPTHFDSDAA